MSDILKSYFSKKNKINLNSSIKYFSSNKVFNKFKNYGLFLTESNILKIQNTKYPKYNLKYKAINSEDNKKLFSLDSKALFLKKFKNKLINSLLKENSKRKGKSFNIFYLNMSNNTKSVINKENIKTQRETSRKTINLKSKKSQINSYLDKKTKANKILELLTNNNISSRKMNDFNTKYNKNNFPYSKSINPKEYIKFNLQIHPCKADLFKSHSFIMKCVNTKKYNRNQNLKEIEKLEEELNIIDKIKFYPHHDDNDLNDLKKLKKIYFSDNLNNENKNNNLMRNNYKILKIQKTKENEHLINFDEKMNLVMDSNKNTIQYLNNLSEKNDSLIGKINILFKRK